MSEFAASICDWVTGAEETYQWGESTLQVCAYASTVLPPDKLITSVRCIILQGKEILAIDDPNGSCYIVPGGRRDFGESVLETLERELLEEVGWTIKNRRLLGFTHFHHLTPKPDGYKYPYPDFCQVIYCGETDVAYPEKMIEDEYVLGSEFRPITTTLISSLSLIEQFFLQTMQHTSAS